MSMCGQACLDRNPEAFKPKIGKGKEGESDRRHSKGCNCKRSGCLKNYCECYEVSASQRLPSAGLPVTRVFKGERVPAAAPLRDRLLTRVSRVECGVSRPASDVAYSQDPQPAVLKHPGDQFDATFFGLRVRRRSCVRQSASVWAARTSRRAWRGSRSCT